MNILFKQVRRVTVSEVVERNPIQPNPLKKIDDIRAVVVWVHGFTVRTRTYEIVFCIVGTVETFLLILPFPKLLECGHREPWKGNRPPRFLRLRLLEANA